MRRRSIKTLGFYEPFLVTICILLCWHFFRISIFQSLSQRCLPTYEFWIEPQDQSWPLLGSFALAFLLLFVLNGVTWLNRDGRDDVAHTLLTCNAVALLSIALVLSRLLDVAQLELYKDERGYASWNRTAIWYAEYNECAAAGPYIGTWVLVSAEVPFLGPEFPYQSIEFRRDLTVSASFGRFRMPVEGRWSPRSAYGPGWIRVGELDGFWTFGISESRLNLSTPEGWRSPRSRVVLERP